MTSRSRMTKMIAAAAAVATIGGVAVAAVTSAQNTQETIDGCRLTDTRAGSQVGPRVGPITAGETITVQATGDNGECTGIPADAESLQIQLTGRNATADTFFTVFNADLTTPPLISHLNPRADISTSSNTTVVSLSAGGAFKIYNEAGQSEVIIDVLGVFSPAQGGTSGPQVPVISDGTASFVGDTVAARFKAVNGGGEVFLGVNDLGVGGNRVEANTTWPDGRRPFAFTYDGTDLTASTPGATGVTAVSLNRAGATGCATPDLLELRLAARNNSAVTEVENLVVNGVAMGGFGPVTDDPADYFDEQRYYTLTGDFSTVEVTGLVSTTNWNNGNENNQLQIVVGCSS